MAAVFSMQGLGQLLAAIVALIVTVAFKDAYTGALNAASCNYACQIAADRAWRIIVGVGAVPACFALYYRITIPETPRYTFEVAKDVEQADADIKAYMASKSEGEVDEVKRARMKKVASPALNIPSASWTDLFSYFGRWENSKVLIGTTLSWFFLVCANPRSHGDIILTPYLGPGILRPWLKQFHRPPRYRLRQRRNPL